MPGDKFDLDYSIKETVFANSQNDMEWLKQEMGIDYTTMPLDKTTIPALSFNADQHYFIRREAMLLNDGLKQQVNDYIENHRALIAPLPIYYQWRLAADRLRFMVVGFVRRAVVYLKKGQLAG